MDFWQFSLDIISYLFAIFLLAFFLIFGYLYITKQGNIFSNNLRYVFLTNSSFYTSRFPTYMVKSQKVVIRKQEIARIDKILINNDNRKAVQIKKELKESSRLPNMRTIIVKKGDTLYSLAEKAYGNASYYRLIFDANPKSLKSKKDLYIGQTLYIPF